MKTGAVQVQWDAEQLLVLHVLLIRKLCFQHVKFKFMLESIVSSYGTAAAIDGNLLRLTPLRQATLLKLQLDICSQACGDSSTTVGSCG